MATTKSLTRYVILRQHAADRYAKVGETSASSGTAALRQVVSKLSEPDGDYIAVPARSFVSVPVSVKVAEPQLVIGAQPKPYQEPVAAATTG
jgi:hypothetical protein